MFFYSFPSVDTKPDIYLNRGPRQIILSMDISTNVLCAIDQVVQVLEPLCAETLIVTDFGKKGNKLIWEGLLSSSLKDQVCDVMIDYTAKCLYLLILMLCTNA
jgi:hypothetical protein